MAPGGGVGVIVGVAVTVNVGVVVGVSVTVGVGVVVGVSVGVGVAVAVAVGVSVGVGVAVISSQYGRPRSSRSPVSMRRNDAGIQPVNWFRPR